MTNGPIKRSSNPSILNTVYKAAKKAYRAEQAKKAKKKKKAKYVSRDYRGVDGVVDDADPK